MYDIRLELAKEEEAKASAGIPPVNAIGPSAFVSMGLEIEEQQWVFSPGKCMRCLLIFFQTSYPVGGSHEAPCHKQATDRCPGAAS